MPCPHSMPLRICFAVVLLLGTIGLSKNSHVRADDDRNDRDQEARMERMHDEKRELEQRVEACIRGARQLGENGNRFAAETLEHAAADMRRELEHLAHRFNVDQHGDHHDPDQHEHGDHEHADHGPENRGPENRGPENHGPNQHGPGHDNPAHEIRQRLQHMQQALEHLHHAGMPDVAHHIQQRIEATARELREHESRHHERDNAPPRVNAPHENRPPGAIPPPQRLIHRPGSPDAVRPEKMHDLTRQIIEMREHLERLTREVQELRERR
ncbi:hypothetical protein [Stieleria varia]|uniref:Uncharacterized protein n=1 Tax=Stieleria varia TaxID=2528005 RepID=A0A5C6B1D3_9BACT|nr:hypothetical protein [Stieleria varia]TWU06125.1 hypothetical protein Pla52n_18450 [Stieleria varia]